MEELFLERWKAGPCGQMEWEREFRFCRQRRFRFDFAMPDLKIAVEIDGRGRHQTVSGVRLDCEKGNLAIRLGWKVFHFPATDMKRRNKWGDRVLDAFVEMVCMEICGVHDDEWCGYLQD